MRVRPVAPWSNPDLQSKYPLFCRQKLATADAVPSWAFEGSGWRLEGGLLWLEDEQLMVQLGQRGQRVVEGAEVDLCPRLARAGGRDLLERCGLIVLLHVQPELRAGTRDRPVGPSVGHERGEAHCDTVRERGGRA